MEDNLIKLDKKRAIQICEVVLNAYNKKEKLFSQPSIEKKMFPEKQLVSVLPKEKQALWLFFSCVGDKMINSTNYYKQFKEFYLSHPDFFDSKNLKNLNSFSLGLEKDFIQQIKVAVPREFIRFAVSNARKLSSEFDGNPINALTGNDFKSSVKNLKQFLGYGTGLASLYLIFLDRDNIRKTKGLVPKIDRHISRISVICDIAEIEEGIRIDSLTEQLSKLYGQVCNENNIDATHLDAAMWVIGKEVCSKKEPAYCKLLCPIDTYCSKDLPKINRKDARLYKEKNNRNKFNLNQLLFDFNSK